MLTRKHITPVLKSLHWHLVRFRIDFKVLFFLSIFLFIGQLKIWQETGREREGGGVTRSKGTWARNWTQVCCRTSSHRTRALPTELNSTPILRFFNGLGPSYLSDLLYQPTRTLRSPGTSLLTIPQVSSKKHGEAAFSCYGPRLWNSLPENLRVAETAEVFKKRLKTHLFNQAFNWNFNSF